MRRFIITGAPGAGKTAIIGQLEFDGFSVVEEAATDVIAGLQRDRQIRASYQPDEVQFHDRCAVCTNARRITFEETVRFEKIHEQTYGENSSMRCH